MKKPGNAVLVLFVLVIKTSRKVKGDEVSHVSQNMGEDGYVYEYSVVDGDSSWMQSHGEWSDGISTHGSYNVKLPDGRIQKVIYTADEHGFRPVISYENPLKGYGLRNHVRLGGAEEHNSEREFTGRNVVRYKENDFDSEGWHEPIPPPFYEMTKLYDVPAHGPKGYDMHKSSKKSKEDAMDSYSTKSSEKSDVDAMNHYSTKSCKKSKEDAMNRYSTKSSKKSEDAMDHYSSKSSEKGKEDAMDHYSTNSREKSEEVAMDRYSTNSSKMSKEDAMDHYSTNSREKSEEVAMDRYSTNSSEKSEEDAMDRHSTNSREKSEEDAMDRYSNNSSEKSEEDAMDRYFTKSIEKPYSSSYVSPAYKRVRYPTYHVVNKYQQGHVMRYPKYNKGGKDLGGKYLTEKAKTYYVNESGKEIYMKESSDEEDIKDTHNDFNVMEDGDYDTRNDMKEHEQNAAKEVTSSEKESNEMANFTAKDMKESSEELVENESEGSEEDESEERSQYVAKMTSMMPPDKPYVPPTYFSIPSSESSSEESSAESSYPSPTTPMPPPPVRSPSEEHPPPSTRNSYEPPLQKNPPRFYPNRNANAATVNAIPSPIYPPFQSPYNYQPIRLPYPAHHLHPMAPYSLTPVTPLYHFSAHHPFSHHHYPSPTRYSHPYMMGASMSSLPSSLYDAPAADEVSEA